MVRCGQDTTTKTDAQDSTQLASSFGKISEVADIPTDGGVALAPHDAAWAVDDGAEVEGVQGTLSIGGDLEVDVRVAERATSDGITADTDGSNGANGVEHLVEGSLVDLGPKANRSMGVL